jgi:superfamily II DNA/RNA helicase
MAAIAFTPNTEQAVALASTAHRLLVRAKAGTGKTALLSCPLPTERHHQNQPWSGVGGWRSVQEDR